MNDPLTQALTPDPTAQLYKGAAQPKPAAPAAAPTTGVTPQTPKLDVSKYAVPENYPSADPATWEKRKDGSAKGKGWLGLLKRPDGGVSSEISLTSTIDGKEVEYPTIVPTLTQQELDWLMTNDIKDPKKIPESIHRKALDHALMRLRQGLSPFAD